MKNITISFNTLTEQLDFIRQVKPQKYISDLQNKLVVCELEPQLQNTVYEFNGMILNN